MTEVTQIHVGRPGISRHLPELSVFELAVARAMTGPLVRDGEQVRTILCDWFFQEIQMRDAEAALRGMVERGFMTTGLRGTDPCVLTEEGIAAVATLYGGCIRMIDRIPANFTLLATPGESGHA